MTVPIFISGIGTGVGKSVVSAAVCMALKADYWKPVQAGTADLTDTEWVSDILVAEGLHVHKETYRLSKPASPHIAAVADGIEISIARIVDDYKAIIKNIESRDGNTSRFLVIEGAGGLMVPLNKTNFIADLITELRVPLILVSRNYLGSINHSLLTAAVCRQYKLNVKGWIFNSRFEDYESEIAEWTGIPVIGSVPDLNQLNADAIKSIALSLEQELKNALC